MRLLRLLGAGSPDWDTTLMARTAGVLYLCGAALVAMSLVLVHPTSADMTGLVAMVTIATLTGIALFVFAEHVP